MNEHWRYFRALEDDLQSCERYVHFSEENFGTYSTEFARILLAAASEFDTVAKRLCREIEPDGEIHSSIGRYRDVIMSKYPRFPEVEIHIPRYQLTVAPWSSWKTNQPVFKPWTDWSSHSPEWWNCYNAVKHERNKDFDRATLKASLCSLAGLLVGLMYWFHEARIDIASGQAPELYEPESYDIVKGPDKYWNYSLPGGGRRRTDRIAGRVSDPEG
jgi:hypothetical protein